MYAQVNSLGLYGLDGFAVTVEADTSSGLPAFDIVGLPDAAVSESRDRVRAAIKNSSFSFPVSRVTVNLAPAGKRKTGPLYDLPILVSILKASGQLNADLQGCAFLGELALNGMLRPITGALTMASAAKEAGFHTLYLPKENAREAAVSGICAIGIENIGQLHDVLLGRTEAVAAKPLLFRECRKNFPLDFSEVKGQYSARRALEIAAAGFHNCLMIGPAGSGKSMLAKRIPTILPPLSFTEAVETTKIHSAAGLLTDGECLISDRPFRSPHHTVSPAGLSGGGTIPRPGEISLAHNGVLFLDEFPEFSRATMEVLRQPLEDGQITISRASAALTYPCRVMLVAAMNPCPCGNYGSTAKPCTCSSAQVERYLSRISGPLLDRIDLHVEVAAVDYGALSNTMPAESSETILARVLKARERQKERFGSDSMFNGDVGTRELDRFCKLTPDAERVLKDAFEKLSLSARAYDKVRKVARTIADLEGQESVGANEVLEAVQYRSLDKKFWTR